MGFQGPNCGFLLFFFMDQGWIEDVGISFVKDHQPIKHVLSEFPLRTIS